MKFVPSLTAVFNRATADTGWAEQTMHSRALLAQCYTAVPPTLLQHYTFVLRLQVYGGAAQDFGSGKANWETYGWSLFKLAKRPNLGAGEDAPSTDVKI